MHETTVRVRYAETDQMGVAYHANHLVWMEIGRVEYCRAAGIRYRDMEQHDRVFLAVVEVNCRYHQPALYDEEVTIRTAILEARPRMVRFGYELSSGGRKIASGSTSHVFCGADMRPTRLPVKYWAAFGIGSREPVS